MIGNEFTSAIFISCFEMVVGAINDLLIVNDEEKELYTDKIKSQNVQTYIEAVTTLNSAFSRKRVYIVISQENQRNWFFQRDESHIHQYRNF